jgi:hypothetical protein
MFIYLMGIWNILRAFGILYEPLVHFVFFCYSLACLGIMYQGKSGKPATDPKSFLVFDRC